MHTHPPSENVHTNYGIFSISNHGFTNLAIMKKISNTAFINDVSNNNKLSHWETGEHAVLHS